MDPPADPLEALHRLHDDVRRETASLAVLHAARLQCGRGCHACCVDGLSVFEIEAERIRRAHPKLLAEGVPHVKDGEPDRDWSGEIDGGPTTNFDADIVFSDGQFVVWPEGTQM